LDLNYLCELHHSYKKWEKMLEIERIDNPICHYLSLLPLPKNINEIKSSLDAFKLHDVSKKRIWNKLTNLVLCKACLFNKGFPRQPDTMVICSKCNQDLEYALINQTNACQKYQIPGSIVQQLDYTSTFTRGFYKYQTNWYCEKLVKELAESYHAQKRQQQLIKNQKKEAIEKKLNDPHYQQRKRKREETIETNQSYLAQFIKRHKISEQKNTDDDEKDDILHFVKSNFLNVPNIVSKDSQLSANFKTKIYDKWKQEIFSRFVNGDLFQGSFEEFSKLYGKRWTPTLNEIAIKAKPYIHQKSVKQYLSKIEQQQQQQQKELIISPSVLENVDTFTNYYIQHQSEWLKQKDPLLLIDLEYISSSERDNLSISNIIDSFYKNVLNYVWDNLVKPHFFNNSVKQLIEIQLKIQPMLPTSLRTRLNLEIEKKQKEEERKISYSNAILVSSNPQCSTASCRNIPAGKCVFNFCGICCYQQQSNSNAVRCVRHWSFYKKDVIK
jgi:hypothetical protein